GPHSAVSAARKGRSRELHRQRFGEQLGRRQCSSRHAHETTRKAKERERQRIRHAVVEQGEDERQEGKEGQGHGSKGQWQCK
ncbi:hypothetical protein GGH17_005565, partial [Coemansia sp. RSA 788]